MMNVQSALVSLGIVVVLIALAILTGSTGFGWGFGLAAIGVAACTAIFCSGAVVEDERAHGLPQWLQDLGLR